MKVTEIMSQPVITVTPETGIKTAAALLVDYEGAARRLVESAVLQVAGVLEVRFAPSDLDAPWRP